MLINDLLLDCSERVVYRYDPSLNEGKAGKFVRNAAMAGAVALGALGGMSKDARADSFTHDESGRMIAQVQINGQGPFRFIIDTGANRTVISTRTAQTLDLNTVRTIDVRGASGITQQPVVNIDRLSGAQVDRSNIEAVVISNSVLGSVHGILGGDSFAGNRLLIDMRRRDYSLGPSVEAPEGFRVIQGQMTGRHILLVPITVNGQVIQAMVDTGAEETMVNSALMQAQGLNGRRPRGLSQSNNSASGSIPIQEVTIMDANLGGVELGRIEAITSNHPVFGDRPGIIIGMDVWRRMNAIAVDFERAELQISP